MKKLFLILAILLSSCYNCFANPNSSISVTPVVANTVISSAAYNTNNNTIQTTFNSHTHTDISQLATIVTGVWAATPITYPFLNLTGSIVAADFSTNALAAAYPVGSIYMNASVATNPATLLGFGTWTAFATGRMLLGNGTSDATYTAGATGGASTHLLTAAESGVPAHTHTIGYQANGGGGGTGWQMDASSSFKATTANAAADASSAHNIMNPYIVVYMWVRTS